MNAPPVDPNDPAAVRAWAAEVHALVLRMQTGERRALEVLYDRTRHVVYGLALRVTGLACLGMLVVSAVTFGLVTLFSPRR